MAESVYKVVELVGTSTESWEKAAKAAVDLAASSLRDLRAIWPKASRFLIVVLLSHSHAVSSGSERPPLPPLASYAIFHATALS